MRIMKVVDNKIGYTEYTNYGINLPKMIVEDSHLLDKEDKKNTTYFQGIYQIYLSGQEMLFVFHIRLKTLLKQTSIFLFDLQIPQ